RQSEGVTSTIPHSGSNESVTAVRQLNDISSAAPDSDSGSSQDVTAARPTERPSNGLENGSKDAIFSRVDSESENSARSDTGIDSATAPASEVTDGQPEVRTVAENDTTNSTKPKNDQTLVRPADSANVTKHTNDVDSSELPNNIDSDVGVVEQPEAARNSCSSNRAHKDVQEASTENPLVRRLRSRNRARSSKQPNVANKEASDSPATKRRRLNPSDDVGEDGDSSDAVTDDLAVWQRAASAAGRRADNCFVTAGLAAAATQSINQLTDDIRQLTNRCNSQQARVRALVDCLASSAAISEAATSETTIAQSKPPPTPASPAAVLPQPRLLHAEPLPDDDGSLKYRLQWDLNWTESHCPVSHHAHEDNLGMDYPAAYEIWLCPLWPGVCQADSKWLCAGRIGPLPPPVCCIIACPSASSRNTTDSNENGSLSARGKSKTAALLARNLLVNFAVRALDSKHRPGVWSRVFSLGVK
uniref:Fibronectin type-III domain-containing protein n=1 Tax=Macrostomum lignano TaxID=282301 RepID=A0A1I8GWD1_9PLAT